MCLDYGQIEMKNVILSLTSFIVDAKKKDRPIDPLLEGDPNLSKLISAYHASKVKHGEIIENSLTEWIQAIPDWSSDCRLKIPLKRQTIEIDNIAFNAKTNKLIIFECKRHWENLDVPAEQEVSNRFQLIEKNILRLKSEIEKRTGYKPNDPEFIVFNTWGRKKKFANKVTKHYEIVCRNEIANIFGDCLWDFIIQHRDYYSFLLSREFGLSDSENSLMSDNVFSVFANNNNLNL